VDSNKPLSIALEEIARAKIVVSYPQDARTSSPRVRIHPRTTTPDRSYRPLPCT
jgi:formate hydrogenlyase subunit 6/NADH:ubiquinone oxidoreductase subunit I